MWGRWLMSSFLLLDPGNGFSEHMTVQMTCPQRCFVQGSEGTVVRRLPLVVKCIPAQYCLLHDLLCLLVSGNEGMVEQIGPFGSGN